LATIAAFIIVSDRSTGPARAKESSNSSSIIAASKRQRPQIRPVRLQLGAEGQGLPLSTESRLP
jgi:hypothetical protein